MKPSTRITAFAVAGVLVFAAAATFLLQTGPTSSSRLVGITQIATHPALDEVRRSIIDGLAKRGYRDDHEIEIRFQNANGDPSLTLPIAQEFERANVSVLVPISTPSALSAAKAATETPIVFAGVSDPVGVGLVDSLESPGTNITGVSDQWPFEAQVSSFLEAFPDRRRLGMLFTRGDDVSAIGVDAMVELSKTHNFSLATRPVSASQDIYPTATALMQEVDAVFVGIDHLILENMDALLKASNETNVPLFGGESGSVEMGAVMAVSINMTHLGDLAADLIVRVLEGEPPGSIPIVVVSAGDTLVNREMAERYGLDVDALERKGVKFVN